MGWLTGYLIGITSLVRKAWTGSLALIQGRIAANSKGIVPYGESSKPLDTRSALLDLHQTPKGFGHAKCSTSDLLSSGLSELGRTLVSAQLVCGMH